ncbi:hypothetical protein DL771_010089 [Monosporascus sp. 5C6A]|nr:hypothetical protein DL771_010089 [Monosporascus sp. 5C6A]
MSGSVLAQPSPLQQEVVRRPAYWWFIQTPACAVVAAGTMLWFRGIPMRSPHARPVWRLTATVAFPIVAWDVWYYNRAKKAVAYSAERESLAQMMKGSPEQDAPATGSSEDMRDPVATPQAIAKNDKLRSGQGRGGVAELASVAMCPEISYSNGFR